MESNTFKIVTTCRACGNESLKQFIDLTDQPLANTYPTEPTELERYPLAVNVCDQCFHTQLTGVVDPDLLYRDYLYVSGTSQTLKGYSNWFAQVSTALIGKPGKVLDIACNDGTQLDYFKAMGWETYGVDPAYNLWGTSLKKGHTVICNYWDIYVAESLGVQFDLITAQNVFAHTDNVMMFLRSCRSAMHKDSKLLIQTSQANMYANGEFDTIYHEHLSFFNTRSMLALVERAGLFLRSVVKSDIHGTSYIFEIGLSANNTETNNTTQMMQEEEEAGLYDIMTYLNFGNRAAETVRKLKEKVLELQEYGFRVVGYGAAAKGMTVLNYGDIKLDYIVDDNPLKQGRYTPGTNIKIYGREALQDDSAPYIAIIPLAWNFFDEIQKSIYESCPHLNPTFVRYFPELNVIT